MVQAPTLSRPRSGWSPVGGRYVDLVCFLKRLHRSLAAANRLRVVAKGYCGIGVSGKLCHQGNLYPLRLQGADERVTGAVWRHIRQPKRSEGRPPITRAKICI